MKTNFLVVDLGLCEGNEIQGYIDVFKNLGLTMAQYRILGFEAFPHFASYCRDRYAENPSVNILNLAVTDCQENVKLYLNYGGGPGNSIFPDKNNVDSNQWVETKAISIIEFLRDGGFLDDPSTYRILKLNIEGCEYKIVRDVVRRGYHDVFDLWIGAEVGIDLLKINSLKPYYTRLLKLMELFSINQHFYCLDDRFVSRSINLEKYIRKACKLTN